MSDIEYTADQVPWIWVASHYDFHISGLAEYQGALCEVNLVGDWDEYQWEDAGEPVYTMEPITGWQAFRWRLRKRAFEIFVGRHWSTPKGLINPSAKMRWIYYTLLRPIL